MINKLKELIKDDKVLLALSGGVDSSVCALLLNKAIGKNLTCVFVDTGLLRLNEADEVMDMFKNKFDLNVIKLDASELFLNNLKGIIDPEEKRKIIGHTFIDAFMEVLTDEYKYFAQGTIKTDVTESLHAKIKTHHNLALPKMDYILLEPLKDLYKHEVRELGLSLGISKEFLYRKPFPGPGLAVRITGEITKEKLEIARLTDHILKEELIKNNLEKDIFQYFTVVTNTKSTAIKENTRFYGYVVSIRAVLSKDAKTASIAEIPYPVLKEITNKLLDVKGVSRVVYDITDKPKGTIEWE